MASPSSAAAPIKGWSSKTKEEHVSHVRQVLQWFLENILFVKADKCDFHLSTVNFLGLVIEDGKIRSDHAKTKAVVDWPEPTTREQLQSFLGFANFSLAVYRGLQSCTSAI